MVDDHVIDLLTCINPGTHLNVMSTQIATKLRTWGGVIAGASVLGALVCVRSEEETGQQVEGLLHPSTLERNNPRTQTGLASIPTAGRDSSLARRGHRPNSSEDPSRG